MFKFVLCTLAGVDIASAAYGRLQMGVDCGNVPSDVFCDHVHDGSNKYGKGVTRCNEPDIYTDDFAMSQECFDWAQGEIANNYYTLHDGCAVFHRRSDGLTSCKIKVKGYGNDEKWPSEPRRCIWGLVSDANQYYAKTMFHYGVGGPGFGYDIETCVELNGEI